MTESQYQYLLSIIVSANPPQTKKEQKYLNTMIKILESNCEVIPDDERELEALLAEKEEERDLLKTQLAFLRRDSCLELSKSINEHYKEIEEMMEKEEEKPQGEIKEANKINYDNTDILLETKDVNEITSKIISKLERARKVIEEGSKDTDFIKGGADKSIPNYFLNL